jgi:hypothetical protein
MSVFQDNVFGLYPITRRAWRRGEVSNTRVDRGSLPTGCGPRHLYGTRKQGSARGLLAHDSVHSIAGGRRQCLQPCLHLSGPGISDGFKTGQTAGGLHPCHAYLALGRGNLCQAEQGHRTELLILFGYVLKRVGKSALGDLKPLLFDLELPKLKLRVEGDDVMANLLRQLQRFQQTYLCPIVFTGFTQRRTKIGQDTAGQLGMGEFPCQDECLLQEILRYTVILATNRYICKAKIKEGLLFRVPCLPREVEAFPPYYPSSVKSGE